MDPRARLEAALGDTYQLQRELGGGGMSRVYLAEEVALARSVVIKVLAPELTGDLSADRFQREIALAARLQHPHIVPLLTAGDAAGTPWYAMPFVEGETLRARLARGALPVHEAVRLLRDLAGALAYAHEHGVIHRDIKPENILLSDGRAVVTDFGVAKALVEANRTAQGPQTMIGLVVGTPAYMAPEQAAGETRLDHRADLYAFGVVAYEMLTGHHPFGERAVSQLLVAHATETPRPLTELRATVPPALAALVMACLAKSPADRPQTARDVERTLDALTLTSSGTTASTQPAGRAARRWPWAVGAAAVLLALVAAWVTRGPAEAAAEGRIAVLPFADLTGDPALNYIGEIAAEELTSGLAVGNPRRVVNTMRVKAVLATAGPDADRVAVVARATGATLIVHGSFTLAGDSLRVHAMFTDGPTGTTIRSLGPYAGPASDPSRAITELRERVMGMLAHSDVQGSSVANTPVVRFDAYQEFWEGINRYIRGDPDGARFLRRAVELDSTFVQGYIYLAQALIAAERGAELVPLADRLERLRGTLSTSDRLRVDLLQALSRTELTEVQRILRDLIARDSLPGEIYMYGAGALRILRVDEALPALLAVDDVLTANNWIFTGRALATAYHLIGDHTAELERTLRGRRDWPDHPALMGDQLVAHAGLGESDRALALADTLLGAWAREVNPLIDVAWAVQEFEAHGDPATARELQRRLRGAIEREALGDEQRGLNAYMAAHLTAGDEEEVRALLPALERADSTASRRGYIAVAALRLGDRARALEIETQLAQSPAVGAFVFRAAIRAHLGDHEEAVRLLRQAVQRGLNLRNMHSGVLFRPLRGHPGFETLITPVR